MRTLDKEGLIGNVEAKSFPLGQKKVLSFSVPFPVPCLSCACWQTALTCMSEAALHEICCFKQQQSFQFELVPLFN